MISLMASNGEYFDLSDRGVIAITIQPNNLGDLNTRSGISSYEFTIPLTAKNIQLLTSNTVECSIYSNNRVLAYGNLTVYEKDLINRTALCSFIGAVSWFDRIKDLNLTDCSLDLTHIYSVDNILSSFNNTSGFIYAPVEFGRSYNELSPIFNTTTNDIMPSVYASSLVRSILEDAGIGVEGELFNDEVFNNTVVFCPNINYPVNVLQVNVNGYNQSISGVDELLKLNTITAQTIEGYFDTTNYVFTNIGATTLQLNYSIFVAAKSSSVNDLGYELKYDLDGAKTSLATGTVLAGTDFTYINNNGTLTIPVGSVLSFYLSKTSGTGNITISTNKFGGTSQELINEALINPVLLLPEMTQQDFMKWVVVSFGVILSYDDVSNTLTFNLFKNVPFKTSNDWSSKVSKVASENIRELTQGYARTNYMAYEGNSDDTLLKNLTDAQLKGSFSITDDSLEAGSDYYTSPFCATLQSVSFQGDTGFLYLPNIQRFAVEQESVASGQIESNVRYTVDGYTTVTYNGIVYNDGDVFVGSLGLSTYTTTGDGYVYKDVSEETVDPLPRVLIVRRGVDVSDLSGGTFTDITVTDGTTPQTSTTMPYAYFHPTVNVNDYLESLSYGLMGLVDLGQTTMIDTYLSYIVDVIENRQLVKFQMALNDVDLNSLDYSKPIYIEAGEYTGQYFLNKIDGYDGRSLTDVYLMKLV